MGGYSNSCSDQSNYLDIFKASLTALCKPQAGLEARKFVTRYFHSELGVAHSAADYVSCCVRHPCWLLISSEVVLPVFIGIIIIIIIIITIIIIIIHEREPSSLWKALWFY